MQTEIETPDRVEADYSVEKLHKGHGIRITADHIRF